jgi:hypothetical protein
MLCSSQDHLRIGICDLDHLFLSVQKIPTCYSARFFSSKNWSKDKRSNLQGLKQDLCTSGHHVSWMAPCVVDGNGNPTRAGGMGGTWFVPAPAPSDRGRHPHKAMMLVPAKISSKKNCSANMRGFALNWFRWCGPMAMDRVFSRAS